MAEFDPAKQFSLLDLVHLENRLADILSVRVDLTPARALKDHLRERVSREAVLAFKDEKLWAALGCMGADGQPQIHVQAYVAMIDFGRNIQEALAGPRWLSGRFALGEARDTLHIEARYPSETIDELERRGHTVDRWGDWNELAGHAHGITLDENGRLAGGYDPRSDGAALSS